MQKTEIESKFRVSISPKLKQSVDRLAKNKITASVFDKIEVGHQSILENYKEDMEPVQLMKQNHSFSLENLR